VLLREKKCDHYHDTKIPLKNMKWEKVYGKRNKKERK
jgi:hypothetical protein